MWQCRNCSSLLSGRCSPFLCRNTHFTTDGSAQGQLDEYGSVSGTCQGCDIGRYATSSESDTGAVYFCNDCETGRYMDVTGVSACLYCASGTFADETASTTSTACASGSSTVTLGTVIWNLSKGIWANELRFLHRWFLRPFVWTDCVRSMRAWVCQRPRDPLVQARILLPGKHRRRVRVAARFVAHLCGFEANARPEAVFGFGF